MQEAGKSLPIGTLAQRTGCSIDTIRYYERMDLLPEVGRSPGGHRQYGNEHVGRLRFIRRSRDLGLGLNEVRDLIAGIDGHANDCKAIRSLLSAHACDVRRRIAELKQLQANIEALLDACGDSDLRSCRIVESMLAGDTTGVACCIK